MTTRPTAQTTTSTGAWPTTALFPSLLLSSSSSKKNPFSAPSAKCPRRCVKAHDQTSERADYNPTQRKGSNEEQPPPHPPRCIFPRVSCTGCSPHMTSVKVPYGRWRRRGSPASSCVARASVVRMSESSQNNSNWNNMIIVSLVGRLKRRSYGLHTVVTI